MKKAFDQTVRDLKREVNKKVLKVPGIEQKILDATNNEPWGPHGTHLADLAQATRNHHEYQMIMSVIWKRINDTGKNWRHVYKALSVLEYLVGHGTERVIDEIKEHAYQISTLADFQYIDSSGRDQGCNVRRKSQSLVALVNNRERIQEVREKALTIKEKYRGTRPGSGDYGDRFDDRNGFERERDFRNRDGERSGRDGDPDNRDRDRYGRDFDEHYGRDNFRDEEYRGGRSNEDQFASRNRRSIDRDTERSFDDDDHYSSRLSEENVGAPPSYEEAIRDPQSPIQHERNGGDVAAPSQKESSPSAPKPASPPLSMSQSTDQAASCGTDAALEKEVGVDEFDPRGSASAAPPSATSPEMDFFGLLESDSINSLDMLPVTYSTTSESDPMSSCLGTNLGPLSATSLASSQPFEDPFGGNPFMATSEDNFTAHPQNSAPVSSFQPSSAAALQIEYQKEEAVPSFDFGDPLGGLTYTPSFMNNQQSPANPVFLPLELSGAQTGSDPLGTILPETGSSVISSHGALPAVQTNIQAAHSNLLETVHSNLLPQSGFSIHTPQEAPASQITHSAPSTNIQTVHSNLLPESGFSIYTPQAAPASSQIGQSAPATNVQTVHSNLLPQSGFSICTPQAAPASSQIAQSAPPTNIQTVHSNLLPQSGFSIHSLQAAPASSQITQSAPPTNLQTEPLNLLTQSELSVPTPLVASTTSLGQLTCTQPSKNKFEPKSAVWADTLSRGLVDLNISGPKTNPLADIGVDFDSINRMEKRKEAKSSTTVTSTITMGKAMGTGSGIGRAGASGLVPSPNTTMGSSMGMGGGAGMGMGMAAYGGNMNQPMGMGMGMGMGMNMGMGMGMNMGMGQGAPMRPSNGMPPPGPGMPGANYNPMMGLGGYPSSHPYGGGGYR